MKIKTLTIASALFLLPLTLSAETFSFGTKTSPSGSTIEVDNYGVIINEKHVIPVMGEIHYARVPKTDWQREIRKMKAGGITVVATYCFWNLHEPIEGRWNWSGNRDLHAFLEVCKAEQMPVVLRIGPFCHGEIYMGGFPAWIVKKSVEDSKQYKLRSQAPGFMRATQRLYANIFAQAGDMLWKNGGTVIGVQIENECRGPWNYYMALRDMAIKIGFDVPFMTRTGWPAISGGEKEFGKLLPLYGDYADGFWDRTPKDMPKEYQDAFIMKEQRVSANIATETFSKKDLEEGASKQLTTYPYLTCELGGGMMPSYHRRINMSGNEAMPLAICKLGSGSNLPGYYMYHGGTNPPLVAEDVEYRDGIAGFPVQESWAETQASATTAHNDLPYMTYDFQAPLGEMGQPNVNAFHQTRLLHQFLQDWGEELSLMNVDTMSAHYSRRGCFEFYNDYVRIVKEDGVAYVRPVGMPFMGHVITADAQPFCKIGNTIYFIPIKGKKPVVWVDGKKCIPLKAKTFGNITVQVLDADKALRAFKIDGQLHFAEKAGAILYKTENGIVEEQWTTESHDWSVTYNYVKEAAPARQVPIGKDKVAAAPTNAEWNAAAVYDITLNGSATAAEAVANSFLTISYAADCARVYADGKLVMDNYWNGKPMLVRLSDLVNADGTVKKVQLYVLPLRKDAPIYLQAEQRKVLENASGDTLLTINDIAILTRH